MLENVDMDFIYQHEGGCLLEAYVPCVNNVPIQNSGVTALCGVDFGQMSKEELWQVPGMYQALYQKLSPYCGITKMQAVSYLKAHPLTLTEKEGDLIQHYKEDQLLGALVENYNADSKSVRFAALPSGVATALFSLTYQNGAPWIKSKTYWGYAITQNYKAMINWLLRLNSQFHDRRVDEAELIEKSIKGI